MKWGLVIILLASVNLSCSSYFKRKDCEKLNWFEHGQKLAMSAKRLTGDEQYNQCIKVDAEISHSQVDLGWKAGYAMYCSTDGAYEKGQNGNKYSFSFCDKTEKSKAHSAYKKGLKAFCQVKKAKSFGASGGVYEKVCSGMDEDQWLTQYNLGRTIYLTGEIQTKRENIRQIDDEIRNFENDRRRLQRKIRYLPRTRVARKERKYNPDTKTYTEVTKTSESDETRRKRDSLNWEMDRVSRKIQNSRSKQQVLRGEIQALQREINVLRAST